MPVVRNRLASVGAGGPRQFAEIRDRLMLVTSSGAKQRVQSELSSIGFEPRILDNADVVIASPQRDLVDVFENLRNEISDVDQAIQEVEQAREQEETFVESATAALRATEDIIVELQDIPDVITADFAHSFADFGPENLRKVPQQLRDIANPKGETNTLGSVLNDLNIGDAWTSTRGEGVTVAIFDTGFARDLIGEGRTVATFHSEDTDSAYAPEEGHGTMCAGAAAANADEGVPFNGAAPGSDVMLVRITGAEGQIRSDLITEAWDWLINRAEDTPIVTNHSYGTPICSTVRTPQFCDDALAQVITEANADNMITSCYAAGNEAMYCGHRLSGVTNGITAHNSLEEVITVGALLSNGRDAQRYSSHGRGDCAPRADPKPNVSFRLPEKTYYGVEDGWKIKDMSTGLLGSSGGTSHASPTMCGVVALMQSRSMEQNGEPLETEEVKGIIQENSKPPRPTQVNQFGLVAGPSGWDARFGYGQIQIGKAISAV